MYQVNLGNKILYYPASEDAVIYDTNLNEEVGLAGEFTFKVPPTNPIYGDLTTGALITIFKDKKEYWRGEIKDLKTDFAKIIEVYCVEDLAWLGDEYMTPAKKTNETYAQRLSAAITAYNANRSDDRKFTVGTITNVTPSSACNWRTEYEWSILDSIRECIARDNGYVKVRRVTAANGTVTRYIDVKRLEDMGVLASQTIEYGYNLLDYVKESDYGYITNVLTPYGDELETEVYADYPARLQGNTITNAESVAVYGRHAKAVVFDNVSDAGSLNALAASYLSRYSQPQLTMEVKAVDLSVIENVDAINLGDSVHIIAKPFAVDQILYLTQIERDLQDAGKNTITLSGTVRRKSFTSQYNQITEALNDIPSRSSILNTAKNNALSMLLDETQGGYVVFEYDANNEKMTAINICDQETIASSTKRWRWSRNGLGYMERANTGVAWSTLKVAMNINGEIVADFVTTGTMSANRIKGDTLTLGGNNNGNGQCVVKASNGSTNYVELNNNGIKAIAGIFGNDQVWEITDKGFHSVNGPTAAYGQNTSGTYIGQDGICNANGVQHVWISSGAISTNGTIYGQRITANENLQINGSVTVVSGGSTYTGATGQVTWTDSGGTAHSFNVVNGIITGIA